MNLAQALRLISPTSPRDSSSKSGGFGGGQEGVALVGSGGKTTALFQLARQLSVPTLASLWNGKTDASAVEKPVIVTATTHLHVDQIHLADSRWIAEKPEDLADLEKNLRGVILVTGPTNGDRTTGLNRDTVSRLRTICGYHDIPLLIEADGSRQRPLKAPAEHESPNFGGEPPIPDFVETVVVVAGLSGLGKPLIEKFVHRPEIFASLSGLTAGEAITPEALLRVLTNPAGGLKNIPAQARRIVLLNQADTPELQSIGGKMAHALLADFDAVLVGTLERSNVQTFERIAGIILAGGESKRFGQPKQLLEYRGQPFVRIVALTALASGLSPVVVVSGAGAATMETAVQDLPITITRNPDWRNGQSSSVKTGLQAIHHPILRKGWEGVGAAIFLLADQPQATTTVIRALMEQHRMGLSPIIAPLVAGQRANPVLFDRLTFPDLVALTGNVGGRAIFGKYPVTYLPWQDESLLLDIDTHEDLEKLRDRE